MEANCTDLTERILRLTLEIIYLLTGEDNIVVKKTSGDGQNSIMVPLRSLLVPERNNEQKILEVTQKLIDLLTGESGIWSNNNVGIKEEIKEEEEDDGVMKGLECLEGHKDLYKDVMIENQPPLTSPDGSSNGNPPERCPRPLNYRDFTPEDHTIPHHRKENWSNLNITIKKEIREGEEEEEVSVMMKCTYLEGHKDLYKDVMMENLPPLTSPDGSSKGNPSESSPHSQHSWDAILEDHNYALHDQGEEPKGIKFEVKKEEEEMFVSGAQQSMEMGGPLYSRNSIQKDINISCHDQVGELKDIKVEGKKEEEEMGEVMGIKPDVTEAEKMHASCYQLSVEEVEMMVTITKEDVSSGGANVQKRKERLILPADNNKEDNGVAQCPSGVITVTQNIHHKLNPLVRSTDPFNSKDPKNKLHTMLPKAQPSFHIPAQPPRPSDPKEASPSKLHSFQGCEKSSLKNRDLVVNWRTNTSRKPFPCSECEKSFKTKSDLFQHHRVHTGEKPFLCPECGKCFQRKGNLNVHIRIHTGEKPFSCCECGKRFSEKGPRDKHMRIHTGEKPFSCSECGKFFAYKMSLSFHQKTHHRTPLKTDGEVL
ncbi:uncharacterized protein [Aquarana catesbeiana]|uniref:uncharacterized protein n=1 Tax=Aquarana catesbeiana TaxID=8400 RepID=UPI003CC9B9A5